MQAFRVRVIRCLGLFWNQHTPLYRIGSLYRLLQVQGDFEASVRDMLEGLDGLWARLEVLHTGVTLTKHWGPGHKDVASAQTDLEVRRSTDLSAVLWEWFVVLYVLMLLVCVWNLMITSVLLMPMSVICNILIMCLAKALYSALGHYRNRLQGCQNHLKDSTQLLQVSVSSYI